MTYRMTVVLEYPSKDHAPRINARTKAKDLGDGEVVALQFSDALRELEALDGFATEQAKRAAALAAENYPQKGHAQETFPSPPPPPAKRVIHEYAPGFKPETCARHGQIIQTGCLDCERALGRSPESEHPDEMSRED